MDNQLKRDLAHAEGLRLLRKDFVVVILLTVLIYLFYRALSENDGASLQVIIIAFIVSCFFLYFVGRTSDMDCISADVKEKHKNILNKKIEMCNFKIMDLERRISSNPAEERALDERQADLYDQKKLKENLEEKLKFL